MARLTLGETWLEYDLHGGSGPRVLWIMGMGATREAWRGQVAAFQHTHQQLTFDNPGIGGSGPIQGRLSVPGMAQDALLLMDHVGWESAHVVGVSLGGMVAQELALGARERVLSLSLLTTHGGGRGLEPLPPAGGLVLFLRQRFAVMRGQTKQSERLLMELLFPPEALNGPAGQEAAEALGSVFAGRDRMDALQAQTWAAVRHDTARRLHELEGIRTLVVRSVQDRLVSPAAQAKLHARIPGAELFDLDEAGHGALSQCRDAINERLREHFGTAAGAVD